MPRDMADMSEDDLQSQQIAHAMLKGWTMMTALCPKCNVGARAQSMVSAAIPTPRDVHDARRLNVGDA